MKKRILFLTGTRADFGKLKPLIKAVSEHADFEYTIFCTGMHLLNKYGSTIIEIERAGFTNVFPYFNQFEGDSMDMILAGTIEGLGKYLSENETDLIVVHGDRVEAMAGACVGALRNILVAHVEGGEVSGTVDELIRHATSKLAHIHFVASEVAHRRLLQLGELDGSVMNIGSPDVDIMLSDQLTELSEVLEHYEIGFSDYAIGILHPVTTEVDLQERHAKVFVDAILASDRNYVLIYPNNDAGSKYIFEAYRRLENHDRIKIFPSIRFEYFLSLMKEALFVIGNSSTGIHEAPVYGVPSIDIGSRQNNRLVYESIMNVPFEVAEILAAIDKAIAVGRFPPTQHYGTGNSAGQFLERLRSEALWQISPQKQFTDRIQVGGR